jgi:hypothetical protein
MLFRNEAEIKTFSDKGKLRQFSWRNYFKSMIEGCSYSKDKNK